MCPYGGRTRKVISDVELIERMRVDNLTYVVVIGDSTIMADMLIGQSSGGAQRCSLRNDLRCKKGTAATDGRRNCFECSSRADDVAARKYRAQSKLQSKLLRKCLGNHATFSAEFWSPSSTRPDCITIIGADSLQDSCTGWSKGFRTRSAHD